MFRFANPAALFLLLLPVMWALLRWRAPGLFPGRPAVTFSDVRLLKDLPRSWRSRLYHISDVLRLLGWVLLVIVIARPQSGQQREVIRGQGIDIVIALDISASMAAQDIAPSRLEGAKEQIERFVQGRDFDRIGLVIFAADAYHYVPPTLDYDLYTQRLQDVRIITEYGLDSSGTAIGTGIASAANMLRSGEADSKIVILLTDGSSNSGNVNPIDAARAAAALGMRVYTIGMGRAMPDSLAGTAGDFDETALQAIASASGGLYFRVADNAGLRRTYDQIDALERNDIEQQIFVNWREQAGPLIVAAFILLVSERFLRQTVFQAVP